MWMPKQFVLARGVGGAVESSAAHYLELKCDLVQIQSRPATAHPFACIRCDGPRCFDDLELETEFRTWIDGLSGNIED